MATLEQIENEAATTANECVVQMPLGLLGFERVKRFVLLSQPGEEPFLRLRSTPDPELNFLVLSPFVALPAYQPSFSEDDTRYLELQGPEDALIFNIVTVRGPRQATINLKGPIVLNRRTLVAKQVIPTNAPDLPVAFPLPLQAN